MHEWHRLRSHILMDAGELGSRHMSVTWIEVPPGASEKLHSHEESEQVYVVVARRRTMSAAGDTEQLAAGDLALIPPATDHAIANDGDAPLALRLGPVPRGLGRGALRTPARRQRPPASTSTTTTTSDGGDDAIRRRVIARGRVQGVFFRDSVRRRAATRSASPAGCATTATTGVEAVFEGNPEASRAWSGYCREGPGRAEVDRASRSSRSSRRASRASSIRLTRHAPVTRFGATLRAMRAPQRCTLSAMAELSRSQLLVYGAIGVALLLARRALDPLR